MAEKDMVIETEEKEPVSKNFIEQEIDKDLAEGPVFRRSTRKFPSFSSCHFFISFPASRFFLYLQQIFNALLGLFLLKKIFLIYYNNSTL